ncbi:MAG: hypothetical protein ACPGO6_02850 [Candidatus Poseidoniaceae archaeon]
MSMLANSKMMLGAALVCLILSAPLSMLSTGAVEGAVDDNFETFPADSACANPDCSEVEEDWATSTGERSYYAWNLTNPTEVMGGADPVYEQVGPFDYDITYTREVIELNKDAGTLKYSESKVYTCAEDTRTPCDMEVTTTNIPFQPQVVGATGTAISGIMDLTKAGFSAGVMGQDLNTTQAGAATTGDLCKAEVPVVGMMEIPCDTWANGAEAEWAASSTGVGIMMANNDDTLNATTGDWQSGDLDKAMMNVTHPFDQNFNISLMQPLGVVAFVGMGEPETLVSNVIADPENSTVMARATTYGYVAIATVADLDNDGTPETPIPDFYKTFVRDWTMYGAVGTSFLGYGGNSDVDPTDAAGTADRMENLLGVSFDGVDVVALLFGGNGGDTPTGLLATNADGTGFGIAAFLGMEAPDAMTFYGLSMDQYAAAAGWAGGWITSVTPLQMGLLGSTGQVTAEDYVNMTLGGPDFLNGGYLTYSLNAGGAWGTALLPTSPQGTPVSVDAATAGNMLYGPLGVATTTGATLFLYGELTGMTPPIDFATMGPGTPMAWNDTTVSMLYGVDANAAAALRMLVRDAVYTGFVPGFLVSLTSDGPYKTQTVNEWLFGWRDPVSAFVAGDITDPTLGWSKLETNLTYYGSGGLSTGPATTYTICTGHNDSCDKGETILEDGSNELSWHNTEMMMATFGLIGVETLDETTGGFLTGDGDKVDAGGYAITAVTCSGTSEVKNIPVDDCTASVDPTTRPITAKLIKSYTLLDAMTPALPIYFGTEINMQAEELSGLIIAGDSTSTFYLDMRGEFDRATAPQMSDLQPVFQIVQSSEIEDDDAEEMESSIVTNQNGLTYWTNFDVPTDYVALLLYLGAISCLILGVIALGNEEDEGDNFPAAAEEEAKE